MSEIKKKYYVASLEHVAANQRLENGRGKQLLYRKNNLDEYCVPEGSELDFETIQWADLSSKQLGISDFPSETPLNPNDINP